MANGGWYGTKEEWERIERQLLEIDPIITGFAGDYGLNVTKNHEGCPERSMLWGKEVRCLMQVYMVDEKSLTFNLWLCASQDRGSRRFWKKETPVREQQIAEFKDHLESLLKEGREKLLQWSNAPDQLEFVTNIG